MLEKKVPNEVKKWRRTTTATSTTTANKKMNLLVFSSKMRKSLGVENEKTTNASQSVSQPVGAGS